MTTQERVIDRTTQKVTVPKQSLKPAWDAYATAKSLGGILATFKETLSDTQILQKAKEGRYLLALDPKDLPQKDGWHRVVRANEVSFEPVSKKEATSLRNADRWNEILYVNESAINAAKSSRPVTLGADNCNFSGRRCLIADDWSDGDSRVAVKLEPKQEVATQLAKHLRLAEGETLEVITRDNEKVHLQNVLEVKVLERK